MDTYKEAVKMYKETNITTVGDEDNYFDDVAFSEMISSLIDPDFSHYLIVLDGSRWNGASGYKIVKSFDSVLHRGYECSIYPVKSLQKGKVLILRESHHDVPQGHPSVIVGLTLNQYNKIENMDIDQILEYGTKYL